MTIALIVAAAVLAIAGWLFTAILGFDIGEGKVRDGGGIGRPLAAFCSPTCIIAALVCAYIAGGM